MLAKKLGVKTGEAIWQAKLKAPNLVTVPPDFRKYLKFSRLARQILYDYTDQIEPFGIDENGVNECLKTLFDHEYISVKYQDDSEICLSPLPKGRLVFENKLEQEIEKEKTRKSYLIYSFLGSFFGGISVTLFAIILLAILWGKRC